eukprot:CAMPEP_0197184910 /NCGR_PEP_ID=MMETSP1423-20130617/10836_1 /TAXON_ID=476441 /ORGANISM="Pseudo-nitzschia heimii, Strain UNC1101" /LENGTH=68 /DNA_ID=CAMNT_0042635853 /DNA_START=273 /DNA_END=476 /DNA_ORIENTATION=-
MGSPDVRLAVSQVTAPAHGAAECHDNGFGTMKTKFKQSSSLEGNDLVRIRLSQNRGKKYGYMPRNGGY